MESDVIWERIRKREQELFDLEDDYNQEKNKIEARQEDLEQRQNALKLLIEREQEEMRCFLSRHSLDYDAALSFFKSWINYKKNPFISTVKRWINCFNRRRGCPSNIGQTSTA